MKKSSKYLIFIIGAAAVVISFMTGRITKQPPPNIHDVNTGSFSGGAGGFSEPRKNAVVRAIEKTLPSVVNIGSEKIVSRDSCGNMNPSFPLHEEFVNKQKNESVRSLGSGFIIDGSGLIVTNAHVVELASKITVTLNSGFSCEAEIAAEDSFNDIALLRLKDPPKFLAPIPCDNSLRLFLGETVIAVGNPFGLDSSISVGTLSGIKRKLTYDGRVIFSDILQTDAIVYPGNSGGPLININGELIGMSMSVYKNAPGIGFAIPFLRIADTVVRWMTPERFSGLVFGIIPGVKNSSGSKCVVFISGVVASTPAWKAGIRPGEIIVKVNSKQLDSVFTLGNALIKLKAGEKISLECASGEVYTLAPEIRSPGDLSASAGGKLGFELAYLSGASAKKASWDVSGGYVVSKNDLSTERPRRGDLLVRLGNYVTDTPQALADALSELKKGSCVKAVFLTKTFPDSKEAVKYSLDITVRQ